MAEEKNREVRVTDLTRGEIDKEVREYCLNLILKDLYPNLLCQDMEKKLAVWFESRLDAREVFRRNLLSDSKKGTP
jgi:hypothetical protein